MNTGKPASKLPGDGLGHAPGLAAFKRAEADAAHKFGLIQAAAGKGPRAIQAAVATADKAARRRDALAKKLKVRSRELGE